MPKFSSNCQKPRHDEWSRRSSRLVNLRVYGLADLASAFVKMAYEKEMKSPRVNKICYDCLQQCLKKRNFSRHLPKNLAIDSIENKIIYYIIVQNIVEKFSKKEHDCEKHQ